MTDKEIITTEEDQEADFTSRDWLKTTSIHYFYESCRYQTEEMEMYRYRGPDQESDIFFGKVASAYQKVSKGFRELAELYGEAPDGVLEFYEYLMDHND